MKPDKLDDEPKGLVPQAAIELSIRASLVSRGLEEISRQRQGEAFEEADRYFWMAGNLWEAGRFEEALAANDAGLEIFPMHDGLWNNKGMCLLWSPLKRLEEALYCLDRALQINPNDMTHWENKADCLEELSRFEESRACRHQAQKLRYDLPLAERIKLEVGFRDNTKWTVLMIEIDSFKLLNAKPLVKNEVLREVVRTLSALSDKGILCRCDEIERSAIIVTGSSQGEVLETADKLRHGIEFGYFPSAPKRITVSIGLAGYPAHGKTHDEVLAAAGAALSSAKKDGGNRIVIASPANPRIEGA